MYQHLRCAYVPFAILFVAWLFGMNFLCCDKTLQLDGTAYDVCGKFLAEGLTFKGEKNVL